MHIHSSISLRAFITYLRMIQPTNNYSAPGRNLVLVVPKRLAAAGNTLEGDKTSTNEKLYVSVPSRLCNQPFPPENPSATTQQLLKPRLANVLATVFAESQ